MPTQLSNNISTVISTTYLDDFAESSRYYKILFRPSTAVQARELNQIQSILQNQISKLGDYSFKDGSIVDGVHITYRSKLPFVRLNDTFTTNTSQVVTEYNNNYSITNSANGTIAVKAYIVYSARGYKANYPDTNRWYLTYVQTGKDGSNNDVNEFQSGDTLYVYDTTQTKSAALDAGKLIDTITVMTSNATVNATGYGYGLTVSDGVIYQKGFFSTVNNQTIVVRNYDQTVNNYVVGFETNESIVTENQDSTLYDNAIGSPNYNAPGAHRLKLTPTLVAKLRTEVSNNFFAIAEFENANTITQKATNDPTAQLMASMAKRTYNESGDYVVRPFFLDSEADAANTSAFYYKLSPGLAYVKGYEVEKISDVYVNSPRAVNTNIENNIGITCNMGNYVIVDEVEGIFNNETLSEVALYDTAQNSLSDRENASSSPSGSIVGYANVRGMQHFTGTKGFYTTQYALYIFNIRMNSGKSFANDVKSFYQNSTGYAKADVVLESGIAVLKDSTLAAAVFPTGFNAVKSLVVNGAASSDTTFNFRQISSTTMAANGSAVFNLDTAAPGGTERLGVSVGNYTSATILNQFNVVAGAAAYSSNIAGSVSITSGSVNVTGTSTTFSTAIANGELIRVANATATVYYQVNQVANNTFMNLVSVPAATYASYNVAHYYPEGHHFNLTSVNAIAGGISFNINTGLTLASGSMTVYGSYPVSKSTAVQAKKDANEGTWVKIDCSNNAATSVGPWDLGLTDVFNIKNIYVGTTYANTNPERKHWFSLDNGQRDDMYDHATISIKPQYAANITGSTKLLIELDHFTANTSAGVGFFTVDSYPIDDANTANTTGITTAQIPTFQSNKGFIDLRNAVDFRPVKYNTATVTTTVGSATINPDASNTSFNVTSTNQYIAEPDSTFTGDFEYYLPRYDIVTMDVAGKVLAKAGESAVIPKVPYIENDVMPIAEVYVPPYPSLTVKEAETYGRKDIAMRITVKTTKRYTMKDITRFDERIKRLEYYVVLNALEQQAKDMNIPSAADPTLNRFKNGIFADPFNSFNSSDVTDIEFKAAIDPQATMLRPFFKAYPVDFKYDTANSTTVLTGSTVTVPYSHVQYVRQPYATKYRNCTESEWQWNGKVDLYPSYDFYRDEKQANNINVNIDTTTPWKDFANSPFGTNFGDWRTIGTSTRTSGGNGTGWVTTTTTTSTTQQRTVNEIKVDTVNDSVDLGNYVSDFSINPYLRSRIVAFVATNLKPKTTMHVFFDSKNVDAYCAPGTLSGVTDPSAGKEDSVVAQSGAYGTTLVSDADGKLYGLFKIPEGMFRTGDRVLRIVNVSDLTTGADAIITSATGTYSGQNISVTKQSTTLNLAQPKLSFSSNTQTQTVTSTSSSMSFNAPREGGGNNRKDDPIAQTFSITRPEDGSTGVYVTKVGVYFYAKDSNPNNGLSVYICETDNGCPDTSKIVGEGRILSANVTTSATGSVETQVSLDQPIMLTADRDYAFIVKPDGNSPEWLIWTAETGGVDVNTGENVFSNPYSGIMFVSANMKAWTPLQKEDIKFNIYRASFSLGSYYAYFNNEDDEYITTGGFTRANSSVAVEIGDLVYSANSTGGPNTAANAAFGRVQYVDESNGVIYIDGSTNGKFYAANNINVYRTPDPANTSYITNTYLVANATISTVDNLQYQAVVPKFATISPILTDISYDFKGTDGSYVKDTSYQKVVGELEYEYLDKSRYAVSKSNEVASMSGAKSSTFRVTLGTSTSYASPAIGLGRKSSLFVKNIINNDATNEYTRYGNANTKYVSKKVVLADGQEAEDLKIMMTAYRPVDTDVKVYVKFWNPSDPEVFEKKNWTLMSYLNDTDLVYSSPTDRTNFYEYEFGVPSTTSYTNDAYLDATNSSILTYVNLAGSKFSSFKIFAVKIVLLSSNPVKIPLINDIRAIALQV